MTFQIDTDELTQAAAALRRSDELAAPLVAEAEVDIAKAMVRRIRTAGRRHRSTGKMLAKVTYRVKGAGLDLRATVYAGGVLAHLVIFGTRRHRIPAAGSARAVPITARGGRVTGYHGAVTHPGQRPDPFFRRGVDASRNDQEQLAGAAAARIAARISDELA